MAVSSEKPEDTVFLRATLDAYALVADTWPSLAVAAARRESWRHMGVNQLQAEIAQLLEQSDGGDNPVRVFWKQLPDFAYAGCNQAFAKDSGLGEARKLVGLNDFNPALSWARQAAGYRKYDEEITRAGRPNLDILERQDQSGTTVFVHTGKAPVLGPDGEVLGILGMYQVLDKATGTRMMLSRTR